MKIALTILLNICLLGNLFSQDLNRYSREKGVSLNGQIQSSQTILSAPNGIKYQSVYQGNLRLGLFGYELPVGFMYSDRQGNFSHPFHQLRINPRYKNVELNVGQFSHYYSPFTVSNRMVKGIGVKYRGDKISLETFVGKPVLPSNSGETVIGEHLFTGMSVGWQTQKSLWKITGLTGMDSTLASFNRSPIPTSKYFEKNTAASFYGRRNLSNKINLEVEYAFSNLITRNHTNQQVKNLYHAFKSGLSWQSKSGSWNVRYDRTDPGYRTHLLTYINNDLENILLGHAINFFSGKINVRTEIGRQRNNLNKQEASEQKNMAYKGSFNAKINKTSTITGHYNTFKSTVISWINNDTLNYQDPNRLDSMVLVSINQQAMLQYSWQILSKNKKRKVLNTSFQIQQADMGQGIQQVINSTTSLVFQNPQKEQNWGIQTTFGKRGFGESNQNTGTFSIYTHRKLFKNWNFSGNMALQLFSQKGHTQFINNNRINISRVIQKKYALSGSISRTSRFEETGNINSWRLQLQCSIKL